MSSADIAADVQHTWNHVERSRPVVLCYNSVMAVGRRGGSAQSHKS